MRVRTKLALLGLLFGAAAAVDGSVAQGLTIEGDRQVQYLVTDVHGKDWQVTDTIQSREDEIIDALRIENEQLRNEVDRLDDPLTPSLQDFLDRKPKCFEDEVIVVIIADVLPDNGVPPDVDWGLIEPVVGCAAADDFDGVRFSG